MSPLRPALFLGLTQEVDRGGLAIGSRYDSRVLTEESTRSLVSGYCLRLYRSGLRLRFCVELLGEVKHKAREYSDEQEIAISLMLRSGLRSHEVPRTRLQDVRRTEDGEHHMLRVTGKDTSGGEGKSRDAWLPDDTEALIHRYSRDKAKDDPLVDKSKRTVQRWVETIADNLANETQNDDWHHLSSHDLRRYWANQLLVEERINPRVVMSLGGWSSFQAIQPYLNQPTESVIVDEMATVDF